MEKSRNSWFCSLPELSWFTKPMGSCNCHKNTETSGFYILYCLNRYFKFQHKKCNNGLIDHGWIQFRFTYDCISVFQTRLAVLHAQMRNSSRDASGAQNKRAVWVVPPSNSSLNPNGSSNVHGFLWGKPWARIHFCFANKRSFHFDVFVFWGFYWVVALYRSHDWEHWATRSALLIVWRNDLIAVGLTWSESMHKVPGWGIIIWCLRAQLVLAAPLYCSSLLRPSPHTMHVKTHGYMLKLL